MTGIGVDAEVMANTNEKVKGVLGWPAYVFAGIGRMFTRGFMVERPRPAAATRRSSTRGASSSATAASSQGNVELMPDAKLDDGILDGVILAPKGAFGWGAVAADLASRHRRGHRQIVRMTSHGDPGDHGRDPIETQIDGDPKGEQYGLTTRILPKALVVRVA